MGDSGRHSPTRTVLVRPSSDQPEQEWTTEHLKVLYLISKYAAQSQAQEQRESWVRQTPLLVLIFEGIQAGALKFDYAPKVMHLYDKSSHAASAASTEGATGGHLITRRLNISQEGKCVLDDLREAGLVNALKLSTEVRQPTTALQASTLGLQLVGAMPEGLKGAVDEFVYPPRTSELPRELMKVHLSGGQFFLSTPGGLLRRSRVMESEDVSYVSSAYVPSVLRAGGVARRGSTSTPALTSNAHRAGEASLGGSTIADELEEEIVLSGVRVLLGEWIPFGANQLESLNSRLGSAERCPGGSFCSTIDNDCLGTRFSVPPGLSHIRVLEFDPVHFINFEAEIYFPEDPGIVQVETLGMHVRDDGACVFGISVEAILHHQADRISLDHLCRLVADVQHDSSQVMSDLLSQYQKALLGLINVDVESREKYVCIFAEAISPRKTADAYMDKGAFENELTQVLGDLHAAHDIGENHVLLVGHEGVLLAGAETRQHEELMVAHVSLLSRDVCLRSYFARLHIFDDALKAVKHKVLNFNEDPNSLATVHGLLNQASRDLILMQDMLQYFIESLNEMKDVEVPASTVGKRLFKVLSMDKMRQSIKIRAGDLHKLNEGLLSQLVTLRQMTDQINTKQLEDVFKNVATNTKHLVDASAASERSSSSLVVMQVICAGSLAFDIVDRASGGTLNIVNPEWVTEWITSPIIEKPMLFWALNMLFFALISKLLLVIMDHLNVKHTRGILSVRVELNRRVDLPKLRAFLSRKNTKVREVSFERDLCTQKTCWKEPAASAELWGGSCPFIEMTYDDRFGFLLHVLFHIDSKNTHFRQRELLDQLNKQLKAAGVWTSSAATQTDHAVGPNFRRMTMTRADLMEGMVQGKVLKSQNRIKVA